MILYKEYSGSERFENETESRTHNIIYAGTNKREYTLLQTRI